MNTFTHNKFALVAVATLGIAFFAAGARADDAQVGVPTRKVSYADLNLDTEAGAKVLYQRIRDAAERVCGDVDSRQMDVAFAAKTCMDRAIVASVRQVNAARLTRTAHEHGYEVRTTVNLAAR